MHWTLVVVTDIRALFLSSHFSAGTHLQDLYTWFYYLCYRDIREAQPRSFVAMPPFHWLKIYILYSLVEFMYPVFTSGQGELLYVIRVSVVMSRVCWTILSPFLCGCHTGALGLILFQITEFTWQRSVIVRMSAAKYFTLGQVLGTRCLPFARNFEIYQNRSVMFTIWRFELNWFC